MRDFVRERFKTNLKKYRLAGNVTDFTKTITVKWTKVKGAAKYVLYGAKCGKANKYKKIKAFGASKKSYKVKKVAGKKLKKKTNCKFILIAFDASGKSITTSMPIHVITKGGKKGNYKSVKPAKKKVTVKKGKSFKVKYKLVKASKKLKPVKHRVVHFESLNPKVATVGYANGKVKGKAKGTTTIYVYAENGVYGKVKVTVK